MKICQCCTRVVDDADEFCPWDGEQSWAFVPDPEPPKPDSVEMMPDTAPAVDPPKFDRGKGKPR